MILIGLFLIATVHAAALNKKDLPEPDFPEDFKFNSVGVIPSGYECIRLNEPWSSWSVDNRLCWKNTKANPGLKWSWAGSIANMRCTLIDEPGTGDWADNHLCVPYDSKLYLDWTWAGNVDKTDEERHTSCLLLADAGYGWGDNYLCSEKCKLDRIEVIDSKAYTAEWEGTQVIGSVTGGSCIGSSEHQITLQYVDSVTETVGVEVSNTNEINWGISASVEVEASAKIFGTGVSVTVGLETSVGGAHSWSRSESKDFSHGSESGVGHATTYMSPGAGLMFGLVDKYKFDRSNLPAKMYFTCPKRGRSYNKLTTINLKSTSYQSAHFESMVGTFDRAACDADYSLPSCVRNIPHQFNNFLGEMSQVRDAFEKCFADGKGTISK